jgi:uncharacterized oxidoreductase
MRIQGNTVLVTGGASGIGLALVERFLARQNDVIVCGRRADKLAELSDKHPEVHTMILDVADPAAREKMFREVVDSFPDVNVLVNNAGIQRRVDLTAVEDWEATRQEIAINLEAPIHLSRLFAGHLSSKESAAIVNVTSGLSFVPLANVPVYCATKAGLHSFTLSLRWQLKNTSVDVVEIIPPAVDTDLQAPGLHKFGVNVNEFADHVFADLEEGKIETAYGTAVTASVSPPQRLTGIFEEMNKRFSS